MDANDLEEAVREQWGMIDNLYLQKLYRSVPHRLMSVKDQLGGPTK